MLNYLWAFMMLVGVLWGAFHGNLNGVTDGALTSAKELRIMKCVRFLSLIFLLCS